MTAREGRTRVPGGEVWYRIVGDGDGIPLLALHGGPGAGSAAFPQDEGMSVLECISP
jgi:proline iminopeptidase